MAGLYLHIPFCKSRCAYCSFFSSTDEQRINSFVSAVINELSLKKSCEKIHTIYLGGGTPTRLGESHLTNILHHIYNLYDVTELTEITVEANPDDITPEFATALHQAGVNRISMGVQSFDDEELCRINRRHDSKQVHRAIQNLREAGFYNISIDLIYGLPGQTLRSFTESINKALEEPVTHISSYALTIEPGTILYKQLQSGLITEVDDELMEKMYFTLREKLTNAGFEHYEISNFARPGYHSLHNSSYWNGLPYIACGPGAHYYDGKNIRGFNTPDIRGYIQTLTAPTPTLPPSQKEILGPTELYDELIFTRLRTSDGLPLDIVPKNKLDYLLKAADKHIASKKLRLINNTLRLNPSALFISDSIISDLMFDE